MKRIPLPLKEIKKLYVVDCLTLREIAKQYGVSDQTISYRLSKAGVPRRPRGQMRTVDRKTLEALYNVEKLTVQCVAERLKCSIKKVIRAMDRYGMERSRPVGTGRKYVELNNLAISESVVMAKPDARGKWQGSLYLSAKGRGMRVSVRQISETTVKVTRVQ